MSNLPQGIVRQVTPAEFLKIRLDPLGAELDAMRTRGLLVGFIPQAGVVHVVYRCNSEEDRCDLLQQVATELTSRSAPKSTLWTPSGDVVLSGGMPTRSRFKPSEWLKLRLDPIAIELTYMAQALLVGCLPNDDGFEVLGSERDNAMVLKHLANVLRAESHRHRNPGVGIKVPEQSVREGAA